MSERLRQHFMYQNLWPIQTADEYDPLQYIQDLIGTLDWIRKFRNL